jgi:hypothetical protein
VSDGSSLGRVWHHNDEVITEITAYDDVCGGRTEHRCRLLDDQIRHISTESVGDPTKVVDTDHRDRDGRRLLPRQQELFLEPLTDCLSIQRARQMVRR